MLLYEYVGRHSYIESTFGKVVYKRKLCKHYSRYSINIELNKINILHNSNHDWAIRMWNSAEIVHDARTSTKARSDQEQAGKIPGAKTVLDRKTFFVRQWRTIIVRDRWTLVRKRHTPKFFWGVPRPPIIMPRKQTDRALPYFASESIENAFSVLHV